jgi:hypothetical protein
VRAGPKLTIHRKNELEGGHSAAQILRGRAAVHALVTVPCQTAWQVNPMRFSSAFQPHGEPPQSAAPEQERAPVPPPAEVPSPVPATRPEDLPDDLDARARLVGEWQLGEAC